MGTDFTKFIERFTEPSGKKGIIAILGAILMFYVSPDKANDLALDIVNILIAVYGVYQVFRNETGSTVKVIEKMKKAGLLSIVMILVIPVMMVQADPFLCVDAQDNIESYNLQIDGGAIIEGLPFTVWTYGTILTHCIYDVGALGAGNHTFMVQPVGTSGWEADWSVPFDAEKPGGATGMRIRKSGG